MRHARHHLDSLVEIHRLPDGEARLSAWRQGMATLAAEAADKIPVPLEGVNPRLLQESVRSVLFEGYVDDVGWLSPAHAASALYELAAALPVGDERREIGRRVLRSLHQGDAATFVAVAERLALGTRRGLSGPGIRARVALALDLPNGSAIGADSLALALLSRPDLEREWLAGPSTGSLPSRRLAARLIDRAAREALRRSSQRYDSVVSLVEQPSILATWARLIQDREPLVWRFVASARGLLARLVPRFEAEIVRDLDPALSPTEWRRAGASLAAMVALEPDAAVARCRQLLQSEVFRNDPGIASAMILGLSRAAEAEPDAADALLVDLLQVGGFDAVEALVLLRQECVGASVGAHAAELARKRIRQAHFAQTSDDGRAALIRALDEELQASPDPDRHSLGQRLGSALDAFAQQGARAAHAQAYGVIEAADELLDRLESSNAGSSDGRQQAFLALREIDQTLLETSSLSDLLTLGARADASALEPLDDFFERLTDWLTRQEAGPIAEGEQVQHFTLRLHRLRAMLHLVDADSSVAQDRPGGQRDRRQRTARLLLERVANDDPSPLRRVVAASAARACDALLREELGELSDVLVLVVDNVRDPLDLTTMAEATMDPAMVRGLRGYVRLVQRMEQASSMTGTRQRAGLEALRRLIGSMPPAGTPRVAALRSALVMYATAIGALLPLQSLAQVAGDGEAGGSRIPPLANAAGVLARLAAGARRRLGDWPGDEPPMCSTAIRRVDTGVEHALRGDPGPLRDAVSTALATLRDELPRHLADVAEEALARLLLLPATQPEAAPVELNRPRRHAAPPLPAWMPPSRILGGFYVQRQLGAGAVGSVFVACRAEDRGRKRAPRFALKVPEYGGDVAHTLSENEFLQLFREEAGALLTVPPHDNLARLVTFDAGAKPKPILVMELVDGPTLQRLVDTRVIEAEHAARILDGVAAGLEAMHAVGVGHLDVKPANVILRASDEPAPLSVDIHPSVLLQRISRIPAGPDGEVASVLVDFGLAGRKIRPGCATASYGAPEIWGHIPAGHEPRPMPADVYGFACLVFETLVGDELFQGANHLGILTSHFTHDGEPPRLRKLRGVPALNDLYDLLRLALRQDPRDRCTISELRKGLATIDLSRFPWPVI
jgi:eukaryotic-like serine/threonine-protein kinase